MNPLRVAVIGAGYVGRIHARLLAKREDVELVAVVDRHPTTSRSVAAEVGSRGYTDFRRLLDQIDAAIVATPASTHHAVGLELARRKVHLLVEKPLAIDPSEAGELVEVARTAGIILQVGHTERFNPILVQTRQQLQELKYIETVRLSGYPCRSTDIGVVLDLMIHDLDIAISLVNAAVERVDALGISVLGDAEDAAQARVVFANGCVANFTASRVSYTVKRQMQVWTPTLYGTIDLLGGTTTLVRPSKNVLSRKFDQTTQSDLAKDLFKDVLSKESSSAAPGNPIADEHQDFFQSIRSGSSPQVTGEQGRQAVGLADKILEQIAEHRWDGKAHGRRGPLAAPAAAILRTPVWQPTAQFGTERREAG